MFLDTPLGIGNKQRTQADLVMRVNTYPGEREEYLWQAVRANGGPWQEEYMELINHDDSEWDVWRRAYQTAQSLGPRDLPTDLSLNALPEAMRNRHLGRAGSRIGGPTTTTA